jgi:methionyl-tRNA synthetase
MGKPFYITTPIYYVNDVPHIGHAYTTIAADVLARYRRLTGREVLFLTGLDEHGQKVQQAAAKAGTAPQAHCDLLMPQFKNLWTRLHISNDAFIRTTDSAHKTYVQETLQVLFDKDLIYQAEYTGWYCTFDERFWTEKDVVDGLCPDCKRPLERLSESNYFFRMGQYQERLIRYIEAHDAYIQPPSRRNEVLGFLQRPLEDLSVSRPKSRLSWGIELPFDPNYVTYVWFDALMNYISALAYLTPAPSFDKFWPADVHLVGKDILTTHAVYWSTILMALELPLPHTIFAHGWWTVNGEKMSKSRGNVVDPYAVVDEFGADAFRYFLLREVPFGYDGDFSRDALIGRLNADLANGLGNLLSRTVTMIERFAQGVVPPEHAALLEVDNYLQQHAIQLPWVLAIALNNFEFNRALEAIWNLIKVCDQYIDKTAPWTLAKKLEDRPRLETILYRAAETLRLLSLAIYPFMPETAEEMSKQLGAAVNFAKPVLEDEVRWGGLPPGTRIAKGKSLFPRIDATHPQGEHRVSQESRTQPTPQPASPAAAAGGSAPPPAVQQITIEEFQRLDLKVARVLAAERVPRSDKLIKLQVDLGTEQRQIVAGIGKKYEPEALVGRRIVMVANLKPAKLMGIESQGMVLAAGDKEVGGLVTILEEVEVGTKVK